MLLNPPLYLHLHDSHLGRRELSHCCAGTCGRGSQGCVCRLLRPRSRVVRVLVTSQRNPFGPSDDLSVTIKGRSPNPKLLLPRHTCTLHLTTFGALRHVNVAAISPEGLSLSADASRARRASAIGPRRATHPCRPLGPLPPLPRFARFARFLVAFSLA